MGLIEVEPLFHREEQSEAIWRLAKQFGTYRSYAEHERIELPIGPGLAPRHDSVANFVRYGGLSRSNEPPAVLVRRTAYFREEYAYGDTVFAPGVEIFLNHPSLMNAAVDLYGRPVVQPAIAYANLMVPGQELAVHTDVPEFRGLNRKLVPQWLLVVMHHSGLFDAWRLPIATAIAWFGAATGGELVHWADGEMVHHPGRHNTAVVLDTDSVFHGVARVGGPDAPAPPLAKGSELHTTDTGWALTTPGNEAATALWADDEVRLSVSWKAYVFIDEDDRERWRLHSEDLSVDVVLDCLSADLSDRAGAGAPDRHSPDLGQALIDAYVRFPDPLPLVG
jgi:hypothetical protein